MTDAAEGSPPPELRREQVELLRALSSGQTKAEAARSLNVSERTLRRRIRELCADLSVGTPVEAIVLAVRQELL